jgi:hypothetical protein
MSLLLPKLSSEVERLVAPFDVPLQALAASLYDYGRIPHSLALEELVEQRRVTFEEAGTRGQFFVHAVVALVGITTKQEREQFPFAVPLMLLAGRIISTDSNLEQDPL